MATQTSNDAKPAGVHLEELDLRHAVNTEKPPIQKAIVRKLDRTVMPVVCLLYLLSFIDRTNAGNAVVLGMAKDLDLVGYDFNFGLTAFYIPYLVLEIPANLLCHRIGPRIWLPFLAFGFGMVTMFSSLIQSYSGFIAVRVMLGVFESGIVPGIAYTLGSFYTRDEVMGRMGVFMGTCTLSGAFGGLLAAGLNKIPRWGMIHGWRNIFFFEGLLCILLSFVAYAVLPNRPHTAKMFTAEERRVAVLRVEQGMKARQTTKITKTHFKRAVWSVNSLLFALYQLFSLGMVSSLSLFAPSILVGMGYSGIHAQLMAVPLFAWACVAVVATGVIADHTGRRGIWLGLLMPFTIAGFIIQLTVKSVAVKYFGLFLVMTGAFVSSCLCTAWALDNFGGSPVHAVMTGLLASSGNIGSVISSWTYLAKDKPRYITGHAINLSFASSALLLIGLIMFNTTRENKLRDAGRRDARLIGLTEEEVADLGHLHPEFRFHA